jgi:zinc/manganese transport system permease protein
MFTYDFMQNAFGAAFVVAIVCGATGYFLVLRGQSFAGHALGHVGFAGAAAAVLLGVSPFLGLLAVTCAGGALMGYLGEGLAERDVAIGVVLSLALGLGLLFLNFFSGSAVQATSLLFGNVLGVDAATLWRMAGAALLLLLALAAIARPLLFASVRPELAAAKGLNLRLISVLFLVLTGVAVAEAVQIVGVLLVFTLMVGPAAAAQRLTPRVVPAIALSAGLACAEALAGVALAWLTDWPASFWISLLSAAVYAGSMLMAGTGGSPASLA